MRQGKDWLCALTLTILATAGCSDGGGSPMPSAGASGAPTAGGAGSGGLAGSSGSSGYTGGVGPGGGSGDPDPCTLSTEPAGSELGQTLPDLSVQTLGSVGEETRQLHELRATCERPGLLVVRVEPAWCEPCGWRADATAKLLSSFPAEAIDVVTVLYAGPDNARPTPDDLSAWKTAHPTVPGLLARSTDGAATAMIRRSRVVPLVLLVDRRTMLISNALDDPDDAFFVDQVAASLEEVGGPKVTLTPEPTPLMDDRFDAHQWRLIQQMAQKRSRLAMTSGGLEPVLDSGGGAHSAFADVLLKVPSTDTPRIQEGHIAIGHILCQLVEEDFLANRWEPNGGSGTRR